MLQGRESLIRVVGKQQRSVSLQDAPPAQILACQVGRKTRSRCLPDTLQRLHHWTCAWISFYPVRSSLIESPLQAICDGGARQLVVEALWEKTKEGKTGRSQGSGRLLVRATGGLVSYSLGCQARYA
ncbi:uncharacterized protein LOC9651996 isoform X3 [Selaginella moellendorffii]|uniref:uncharacterized protein LOC9651996 isoform X3 n=1 Tax=Selaginella moellendorffii TaxID=88036 RepID=UPI000D1C748B|nr:uncharacterized protein LOC9651996 isoform X3 [Selaginella moellendorffii]|eukprot:XP_024517534.1 uncharacterized protein LOC9651996 isoform X3 [Selaginella moellendorffii]